MKAGWGCGKAQWRSRLPMWLLAGVQLIFAFPGTLRQTDMLEDARVSVMAAATAAALAAGWRHVDH